MSKKIEQRMVLEREIQKVCQHRDKEFSSDVLGKVLCKKDSSLSLNTIREFLHDRRKTEIPLSAIKESYTANKKVFHRRIVTPLIDFLCEFEKLPVCKDYGMTQEDLLTCCLDFLQKD